MKIKITCNWCNDDVLLERFNRVYSSTLNKIEGITFTSKNDYNYLVIINSPHYNIFFPKEKTLGVIMEPSWTVHYNSRFVLEERCQHIIYHKKTNNSQYIYYPGTLPFHFDYQTGDNLDFFIQTDFIKTKKCSMVVSYNETTPHPSCLYYQRTNLAKQILKTDLDIDIYGNNWDRSGILDQRLKGQVQNKKDALTDYEFSIAVENCIEQGYFTEKITDCILTNTTPIYYGCPDIDQFISNIYKLPNLDQVDVLTNIIQNCKPLKQDKNIFATKFNLYKAIIKYFTTKL